MGFILVPSEVGGAIDRSLTVDGVKQLIHDLTEKYGRKPSALLVSEHDRRDMNQDIMGSASQPVAKQDQRPEHDGAAIGYIEGVAIVASSEMSRGKCRPIFQAEKRVVENKLGGEGKIIVGA